MPANTANTANRRSKAANNGSLAKVAAAGNRLATLQTLRDRLARDLDNAEESRDVTALALRLTDVLQQIDDMPVSHEVSRADEIAERRAARRKVASK